ncbi:MAG TPA: GDSL-type esterase/lipase family protein [Mycobacterium sp.]
MRKWLRSPILWGALALVVVTSLATASIVVLRSPAQAAAIQPLRIAVIGGYETVGTQNLVVWPTLMAERTGWAVSNGALPDAGYVADGRGGYAFIYQVDRALASDPDLIVVVGGGSDTGFDLDRVRSGVVEVLGKLARSGTRTLVVGPTWYESPVPANVAALSDAIRTGADSYAIPYLDALDPPWLTSDLMRADRTGPTDEGQAILSDHITEWVRGEVDT